MAALQLSEMLSDLKSEVGYSLTLSHGVNRDESLKYLLKRTQRELYASTPWPQLMTFEDVSVSVGQGVVGPLQNITAEQIERAWCEVTPNRWSLLRFGIEPADRETIPGDSWPVERYRIDPINGIEIWPSPSQAGRLRFRGQMALKPLNDDAHMSTLDGTMIVLFAAAEVLASEKDESAALKLQKAQQMMTAIKAQYGGDKADMATFIPGSRPARSRFAPRSRL